MSVAGSSPWEQWMCWNPTMSHLQVHQVRPLNHSLVTPTITVLHYIRNNILLSCAEFAEYEMICKALRREHQELQEDVTSLKEVVYRLEGLHKEYQVCMCV